MRRLMVCALNLDLKRSAKLPLHSRFPLPFKGRVGVGMVFPSPYRPKRIPLPSSGLMTSLSSSPLKGEGRLALPWSRRMRSPNKSKSAPNTPDTSTVNTSKLIVSWPTKICACRTKWITPTCGVYRKKSRRSSRSSARKRSGRPVGFLASRRRPFRYCSCI